MMGLLLSSVLAVSVGVVELLAFYHNVIRSPSILEQNQEDGLHKIGVHRNLRELNRERLRLLNRLGEEDNRPDLSEAAHCGHFIKTNHAFKQLNNNHHNKTIYTIAEFPALQIRKASLVEESLCKEDIIHHIAPDSGVVQQSTLLSSHHQEESSNNFSSREQIFGQREGSPFPTYDLLAPRNSTSGIDGGMLEVDEADIDRGSITPTPQKIDMILQESNFDKKNFWPSKNMVEQRKKEDITPPSPNKDYIEVSRKSKSESDEDKFKVIDNRTSVVLDRDEEDAVLEFDTSVLQRIDGLGAKPLTPSEEKKLKLKKKRNSKSYSQTTSPEVSRQTSAVDNDGNAADLDSKEASSSKPHQEPFWVNWS